MLIVKSTVGKIVLMTSKMHFGSFGLSYSFQNLSNRFHFQTAVFVSVVLQQETLI